MLKFPFKNDNDILNQILKKKDERIKFLIEDCLTRKILFEKAYCEKPMPFICPYTGQIDLKYNPEHVEEDFYLYTRL